MIIIIINYINDIIICHSWNNDEDDDNNYDV